MQQSNFFDNTGGLNLTDSAFYVADNQATFGQNYDLTVTGGIQKSRGRLKLNSIADAEHNSKGIFTHITVDGGKTVIRASDTHIQTVNLDTAVFTAQSEDTTAVNTTFFLNSSNQPVVGTNFNTPTNTVLWMAGKGASKIYGYTGSKVTANGIPDPSGTFTVSVGGSGGSWSPTGTYHYAIALRKASTQALSNAALDKTAVISGAGQQATLTFPTGIDTTKYDQWYVYRSAVGGVTNFTTGDLIAQVPTTSPTYVDNGNVFVALSVVVPRAGGTTDNSPLPDLVFPYITAYKRQLVAASGSTVYFSDLNKPESWPIDKSVSIPTGGPITGLAVIGYSAPITSNIDEYLVIFKERETWVITGTGALDTNTEIYDLELKFVDNVGCANQSLVVNAGGIISWIDARGIYIWTGANKPVYVSRLIEGMFGPDGELDKTKLKLGCGTFFRKLNQIVWHVSSRTYGENKLILKMDLRLTVGKVTQNATQTVMDGVFTRGKGASIYACTSYLSDAAEELYLAGDSSGFLYKMFSDTKDDGAGIDFSYDTKFFDFGKPSISKTLHKVIVWIYESVPKNLELQYWSNYKNLSQEASDIAQTMEEKRDPRAPVGALWDLAVWDVSFWDEYTPKIKGIVYNLSSAQNNNTGDSFKFSFVQNDADAPVTIHGFTAFWSENALQK